MLKVLRRLCSVAMPLSFGWGCAALLVVPLHPAAAQQQALKTTTNSIGMELVLIPAGKFRMGSPASEEDRDKDEDQVDVTLTKAFYVGKTEVTQGQWKSVLETTPWKGKNVREGDDYAATYVSWEDAQAFCKKLSEKERATYRLPTEAEWEYACRAGTTTRFSFGDDESQLGTYSWYEGGTFGKGRAKGEPYAHRVATRKPNAFGLYDMHGNVIEWCEDVFSEKLPGDTDPLVSQGSDKRAFRFSAPVRSPASLGAVPSNKMAFKLRGLGALDFFSGGTASGRHLDDTRPV